MSDRISGRMLARRGVVALAATFAVVGLIAAPAAAQYADGGIKIGVLTDMSGGYSDLAGRGSVTAAQLAVEDFGPFHLLGTARHSAAERLSLLIGTLSPDLRSHLLPILNRIIIT